TTPSWGGTVELTATVAATASAAVPASGTVTFRGDGGTELGTASVGAGGIATLVVSASALGLGSHELTAQYAGSARFAASTESEPVEVVVGAAATTTTVTAPTTVTHGHALTLNVAVTGGAALPDDGSEV